MNQDLPSIAYEIIAKLWRLNRIFCSSDYDASLEYLSQYLPFRIHEYRSSEPYKGWVIPPKWELIRGVIRHRGEVIYEVDHPLKIIGLSSSFKGIVSLEELKKHLHYDHRHPERIPYHFRQHYRPWERDWGFCVSQQFFDSLEEGEYHIEIVTEESEGYLKVAEYVKEGKHQEGIAIVAHLDHPGMANDDLSGVAVGVELFNKLSQLDTKFTYRLVLVQEMIGSVFYLDRTLGNNSGVLESCFIEMLGSKTSMALQSSYSAKGALEMALEQTIVESKIPYRKGPFRSIVCNDDNIWESHHIPMCSIARFPYPEYHSDHDNLSIMSQEYLTESVNILYKALLRFDQMTLMEKRFEGVLALAHPSYQLYIDPGQPAFSKLSITSPQLRRLMDDMSLLPRYTFLEVLAKDLSLERDQILNYLRMWESRGLIALL